MQSWRAEEVAPIRPLVIVPAFNESATLANVLASLADGPVACDVVVVDDGSTDGTADIARSCGAVVLQLPFNLGIGGALRTGFRYAVEHGYEQALQLDADGQHDVDMIPVLLAGLDDADFVVGSRFGGDHTYEVGTTRRSAMRLLRLTLKALSGRSFTDTSSGFRAFDRGVLELFASDYPVDYMESVEALLMVTYAGFRVTEVPIQMHQRAGGEASNHRLRLAYHYVRLFVALLSRASLRNRVSEPRSNADGPSAGGPGASEAAA